MKIVDFFFLPLHIEKKYQEREDNELDTFGGTYSGQLIMLLIK